MKKLYLFLLTFLILQFQYSDIIFAQWIVLGNVNTTQLNSVTFFNAYTGVTCGIGGMWRTTNSGYNWTQVLMGGNFNSLSFPDSNTGFVVGDSGNIFKSNNNGLNWYQQNSGVTDNLNSVSFFDINTGQVVGQNGRILRTINQGYSWTINYDYYNYDLNCVRMFGDNNHAMAAGSSNTNAEIFERTANGGLNWYPIWTAGGSYFKAVTEVPPGGGFNSNLIAVGARIARATDGGINWTPITNPTNQVLNGLIFIDANSGYSVGNQGVIIYTTNSGLNWTIQTSPTTNNLTSVHFININTGWAVGHNGIVIGKGTPSIVQRVNSKIPSEFKLFQNYPNPFNPVTIINYQIPYYSNVKLIIYDIMGKKVDVLVNEKQQPGEYEVKWDASNYPSGIYIYKLITSCFTQIKKLILLK